MNPDFRRAFLPKAKNDEKSVIAAFAESNKENALKTKPQVCPAACSGPCSALVLDADAQFPRDFIPNTGTLSS